MATLQSIRSKGPLLLFGIGLALLAFIAGDAWQVLQPHKSQDVGEVNGNTLSATEYQTLLEEYTDIVKLSNNLSALTDAQSEQIKDEVWQTYVNNQLIQAQTSKLGLTVTREEVQDIIDKGVYPLLNNTPFVNPNTGIFDKDILKNFLAQYAQAVQTGVQISESYAALYRYWNFVEKTIRNNRLAEKYQALITKSLSVNEIEAKATFDARTQQTNLLLAAIPYSAIPDSTIQVKVSEVKDLYKKQKEQYRQYAETRDIKYIDVQITASDADKAALDAEMATYTNQLETATDGYAELVRSTSSQVQYADLFLKRSVFPTDINTRLDSIAVGKVFGPYLNQADNTMNSFKKIAVAQQPDSIQYRQIQVVGTDFTKNVATADSIYTALKGGADFEAIAEFYGQTGEKAWLTSSMYQGAQLSAEDVKYLSTLANSGVNQITNLSLGAGQVILQVTARKAMTEMYKVAIVKKKVDFSAATYDKYYNEFSQFIAANSTLEDLNANAEEAGYRLLERKNFASSEHGVAAIRGTRDALRWAFEAKTGQVSGMYECGDGDHLLVVALEAVHKAGYRPWDDPEVRNLLRNEVVRDKKAAIIMDQMKEANATDMNAYKSLPNAVSDSVKLVTFSAPAYVAATFSSEPLVSAYASVGQAGQISAPIKGNGGVMVMEIYGKDTLSETFDAETEETNILTMNERLLTSFTSDLYRKANVKDQRYLYF
ncbi:MAG: SurA N-terminal domain-containing protein [Prevotellaceae bacterium]|jgi:peptidyl-prolyl cis-trans isomerase D|nr:SurA N-terminal domain-containing protein [Prevotellaceae bacterium]